jgi:hypothetical protein
MNAYIWQDQHDPDQYYLGIRTRAYRKDKPTFLYSIYAPIFVDGLYEVLGLDKKDVEEIGTDPVEIDIKAEIL